MRTPLTRKQITIGGSPMGRITRELFTNTNPRDGREFLMLLQRREANRKEGKPLWYKGSAFHSVDWTPDFMCEEGDYTRGNVSGRESIYGDIS
ncbi:hypothetical protein R1flu_015269 [Riccia fluitans]|uniref:PPIase cyclophilin-type domain-containing protein n=1 Tax=Riccia fluitans TaxID=41844 RepID=A0ABD1YIP6_9MARC